MSEPRNARVVLEKFGSPDGFRVVEGETLPVPGPGQIRVRVLAASVQFTDVLIRLNQYPDLVEKPPFTPGYDLVGEIDAIGPGVTGLALGDRVADLTTTGSYARYRLLDAARVVPVPPGVDPVEATTLVLGWMTAYQLLHRHAEVKRGQSVLVIGAAGAVGQALLRLGQLAGVKTYGAARAEHADLVASLGATPIDYRTEDYGRVLPDGVDVVFDGIGVDGFAQSWALVKKGGFLSAYGFSHAVQTGTSWLRVGGWFARIGLWNALPNGKRAGFYGITQLRKKHPEWFRKDLTELFGWLADGTIRPRVAARIGLGDVADAHRKLEAGGLDGKLVLVP